MKRHFLTGLKALAVGVMTLLAVSCYDDTQLWAGFEKLEDRVDALEAKINEQVATLNSVIGALEAKVAVVKVEKNAAGNYVLTFSNNETLEISAADANANNTNLITTVTEDGKTYWAVVGADGKVTKLNAVVHPDTKLLFKVDSETGLLMVSYDGTNYESTGVFVNDDTTFNVVEKFVDAEGYVVLTVGGVEYKLPKVSENSFDIVSGKVFFDFGETKNIPVEMNGVVSSMVAKVPAGWNVKLSDNGLKVTAPYGYIDEEWGDIYLDNPEDETSGIVELWVVTEDGKTLIGKVAVTLASPADYAVMTVDGNKVRIDVGDTFIMGDFYYGACKMSDYDPEALFASIAAIVDYDNMPAGVNRFFDSTYGDEPWVETTMDELLGAEMEFGNTYVVWGICLEQGFNMETYKRELISTADDFIVKFVTPISVEFAAEPSWNDATLAVDAKGAEKFFGTYFNAMDYAMYEEMFAPESLEMMGMDIFSALQAASNFGTYYEGAYNGPLSTFGYPESEKEYALPLFAGSEYVVVLIPMEPYRDASTYTINDAVIKTVETNPLVAGGAGVVTFAEPVATVSSFTVDATSTATFMTVYDVMETAEYEALVESFETGATMQDYLMENYSNLDMTAEKEFTVRHGSEYSPLTPDTSYTVITMAIDEDGTCGEVCTLAVKTLPIPYDESITVSFASVDASTPNQTKVVLDVKGADKVCVYTNRSATYNSLETFVMNYGVAANYYGYQWVTVEDGKATATVNAQYNKNIYAVAYNVTDGKVSGISHQIQTNVE